MKTLVDEKKEASYYEVVWDSHNDLDLLVVLPLKMGSFIGSCGDKIIQANAVFILWGI